jgi:LysR family transcriptional regulator for bpeEF and oprC
VCEPACLSRRGVPRSVEQLAEHDAVLFRQPTSGRPQSWQLRSRGVKIELDPPARILLNDGEGMAVAACAGLGIAQLPDYMVVEQMAAGTLVEVLPSCRPAAQSISAVVPSGRLLPRRVSVGLQALASMRS